MQNLWRCRCCRVVDLKLPITWLTRLANKFAAVSKVHDLITCESKVQVVVSLGSYEVLFDLRRHEVLTNDT